MKKRFMVLLALMTPAASVASDWYFISETKFGGMHYIDASSITTQANGTKRAWFSDVDTNGNYSKTLFSFICTTRELDLIRYIDYDNKGQVLKTGGAQKRDYSPVTPDTVGETMFEIACSKSPKIMLKSVGTKTSISPEAHSESIRQLRASLDKESSATIENGDDQ